MTHLVWVVILWQLRVLCLAGSGDRWLEYLSSDFQRPHKQSDLVAGACNSSTVQGRGQSGEAETGGELELTGHQPSRNTKTVFLGSVRTLSKKNKAFSNR